MLFKQQIFMFGSGNLDKTINKQVIKCSNRSLNSKYVKTKIAQIIKTYSIDYNLMVVLKYTIIPKDEKPLVVIKTTQKELKIFFYQLKGIIRLIKQIH